MRDLPSEHTPVDGALGRWRRTPEGWRGWRAHTPRRCSAGRIVRMPALLSEAGGLRESTVALPRMQGFVAATRGLAIPLLWFAVLTRGLIIPPLGLAVVARGLVIPPLRLAVVARGLVIPLLWLAVLTRGLSIPSLRLAVVAGGLIILSLRLVTVTPLPKFGIPSR
jgi:hypothetical protein